ncbi:glycoside hydrolase family 65 protein [Streptomyces hoynatensis]|uniref:Glycoside hydrolase family 65 protein n=1 Tax=Streptomyces hoynatensis TaxID=1141874 RepID=A0A3A9ZFD5_9ACTN|nr:glycoside hydrolase family 65 protein [Streptomyces hoynatensis]
MPNWLPLRFRIHPDEGPADGEWFTPDALVPEEPAAGGPPGPGETPASGGPPGSRPPGPASPGAPALPDAAPTAQPTGSRPQAAGAPAGPGTGRLLDYRQALDLRQGTLTRRLRFRDRHGRHLTVEQSRLVHMGDPHLAALRTTFVAEDWSGTVEVESALDGTVVNEGVARYRDLAHRHLTRMTTGTARPDGDLPRPGRPGVLPAILWLRCRTSASDIRVVLAARLRAVPDPGRTRTRLAPHRAAQRLSLPVAPGGKAVVEKTVALHTSRDKAVSSPLGAAVDRVRRAGDFAALLASHAVAWERLWRQAELDVPGEAGRILRLHLFHLLQTLAPAHTAELDVGVPARGLHGEAYRGHVFWDELFVLPYLNLHFPGLSKALLTYRYRRLPRACRLAAEGGAEGAMYPWQSGSDGREETPVTHLNPRSGRWLPDNSRLQHHVGSAVAYNVWRYWEATGDTEFVHTRGAEMLLQIARFWAHSARWDPELERYRIRGVVGPDEYHEGYPEAAEPGLDDNAYTNVTAAWVLARALDLTRTLPHSRRRALGERIGLDDAELGRWDEVSRRLFVPFHQGVVSQFAGYGELRELDWEGYRRRYGNIRRLDRLLEAEGDTVNRYQASKQADVLMLGYLFPPRELAALFARLGYRLDDELWRRTVDYYLARTSHGSTLSGVVHAWVLARARHAGAWSLLEEALAGDVADVQGGTTAEGIHLGAMAGTVDLVQRGLLGLETREGALCLDPAPLPELSEFAFSVRCRGVEVRLHLTPGRLRVAVPRWESAPVRVVLSGRAVEVPPGEERLLPLNAAPAP